MPRLRTIYRNGAAEVPALEVEAASENPAAAASTPFPEGSGGSLLGEQLAAQREAERLARMAERIDVPPPSDIDSAIDEARDQSVTLDRHTTPDLDTRDDGGDLDTTLRKMGMPELAVHWLKANPEYLYDPERNEIIQAMHHDLVAEGFEGYSGEYFVEMDRRLHGAGAVPGMSADDVVEAIEHQRDRLGEITDQLNALGPNSDPDRLGALEQQLNEHQRELAGLQGHLDALPTPETTAVDRALAEARGARAKPVHVELASRPPVSAPPSRETPSWSNGSPSSRSSRITLTPQQKEAARIAGISEEDYARGLTRLAQEKSKGHYGGQP